MITSLAAILGALAFNPGTPEFSPQYEIRCSRPTFDEGRLDARIEHIGEFESPNLLELVFRVERIYNVYADSYGDDVTTTNLLHSEIRGIFSAYRTDANSKYSKYGIIMRRSIFYGTTNDRHGRIYSPPGMTFDARSFRWIGYGLHNHWVRDNEAAYHTRGGADGSTLEIRAYATDAYAESLVQSCLDLARLELTRLRIPTDQTPDLPTEGATPE